MRNSIIAFLLLIQVCMVSCLPTKKDHPVMRGMVTRLIPKYADRFSFEEISDTTDYFELESVDQKIIIRGNNANSMAVGLNYYLKNYCLTTVSWFLTDSIEMPDVLPQIPKKEHISASVKDRFFLNYCTSGYTMPWWKWQDWERFIDWMALNGVNMPLATTGMEAVLYNVWTKMGLTDEEARAYFTGPAHLPWNRMSNLDYWQGPLPKEWIDNQVDLQKQIVAREREFNMKPILPAYGGHVPQALKRIYPEAKITTMSRWGGFSDEYRSSFLHPSDKLFARIQKEFIEEQTRLFGSDHIYGVDPFNEVEPPSWQPDSLAEASKHIYETLTAADKDARWLQMTWIFYFSADKWTQERIEPFLRAVPQDKMILLDYFCENTEIWKQTKSYYGQPFIWCYLGNFGGNTMLAGNIKEVGKRIADVKKNGGANFTGLGSTLEALDVNPFMYEFVLEKAWNINTTDEQWMSNLADRHVGKQDEQARKAFRMLYDSIYIDNAALGQATLTNARPTLTGHSSWTTNPQIVYKNKTLFSLWETLLKVENCKRDAYLFDVVNIGRQLLGNHFQDVRDQFTRAYDAKDLATMKAKAAEMNVIFADMELLLTNHSAFSLHKWITSAREFGHDDVSKSYYEQNARNLLSTWGGRGIDLNDYANRGWSGLVSSYYAPRWKMFTDEVIAAVESHKPFDDKKIQEQIKDFEFEWMQSTTPIQETPKGDVVNIGRQLIEKYRKEIVK